jgi:ketosteroid isomerase-like protein
VSQSTGSEKEIVELHEAWFAAAAAKDLDASMAPISPEIVSYEHTAPLQFTEIDAIREECKAGFDRAAEDFTWTVPDLRVVVRDDLAVAWGLNRMADRRPDGTEDVTWSRGTRVFQRIGGRWRMVHQHVSFPVDPTTGRAATDLAP